MSLTAAATPGIAAPGITPPPHASAASTAATATASGAAALPAQLVDAVAAPHGLRVDTNGGPRGELQHTPSPAAPLVPLVAAASLTAAQWDRLRGQPQVLQGAASHDAHLLHAVAWPLPAGLCDLPVTWAPVCAQCGKACWHRRFEACVVLARFASTGHPLRAATLGCALGAAVSLEPELWVVDEAALQRNADLYAQLLAAGVLALHLPCPTCRRVCACRALPTW
jgi:hypothetical protein